MKLTVHPEGVAILGAAAAFLFFLAVLVLRDPILEFLLTKAADAMEEPSDFRPARRRRRVKFDRERWRRREIAFYVLCSAITLWMVADWLWLPSTFSLGTDWRWPLAGTAFLVGVVVIFIGSESWDARVGWSKWTFWYALLASTLALLLVARWMHTSSPRPLAGVCILGGIFFFWIFGILRRIDRNKLPMKSPGK